MFGFFAKRPAIGLFLIVGVLGTGIAIGARTDHRHETRAALSLAKRIASGAGFAAGVPSNDWRAKLDLDQARLVGGKYVQSLGDGRLVTYSLDPRLQAWALEYLKRHEVPYAAMVMMEVTTGKVVVMAGHAAENPKVNTRELCLRPWAPAASIYKLITAAALLDHGVSPETTVCYHGGMRGLQRRHLVDNARADQACNSLSYAIAKSINPIMGKLALRHLTQKDQQEWSYRFGFNRPIPFELPVQPSQATIPAGDVERARVAAGFWKTETSVLHGAMIGAVAASRGMLVWPSVVESVRHADNTMLQPQAAEPERAMSRALADKLAAMMLTTTTIGTASRSFHDRQGNSTLPGVDVGGKTGSLSRHDPFLHYSWFVGFAPASTKKPSIAFAVLLGNPAKWRIKAHHAARMMLTHYYNPDAASRPRIAPAGPVKEKRKALRQHAQSKTPRKAKTAARATVRAARS